MPRAVLWDMDGTIVDTEPYWMTAETEMVRAYGGTWTHEEAMQLVGSGLMDSAEILRRAGVDLPPEELVDNLTDRVRDMLRDQGVPFRPGARELLRDLQDAGIPCALVTMSLSRMAQSVVDLIDFEAFTLVIGGDEVPRPKPFPDPYLLAAERLGVDITDVVILEDSPTGVRSGVASGGATIGVPHLVSLDGLGADALWSTLDGRGIDDLAEVLRVRRSAGSERTL